MSQKPRSRAGDYCVYLAVRIGICVVRALPHDVACTVGRFLGWLAYHVDGRHRRVAKENIALAFPGKYSDDEIDRMVRAVYQHFCRVLVEIASLDRRLRIGNWKRTVEMPDSRHLVESLLSDRPMLLVSGHFGNWEVAGYVLGLLGFKTHAIARPLANPYLDDYLRRFRERTGQHLLAKRGDFERIEAVLKSGGMLGTLADQDAGERGMFVDFFGRPASTHKAVALLALEHNVSMQVVTTPFEDGMYRVYAAERIDPADYEKNPNAVHAMTQRFTSDLEKLVRRAPEQYFWLHRRWKHQPRSKTRSSIGATLDPVSVC